MGIPEKSIGDLRLEYLAKHGLVRVEIDGAGYTLLTIEQAAELATCLREWVSAYPPGREPGE